MYLGIPSELFGSVRGPGTLGFLLLLSSGSFGIGSLTSRDILAESWEIDKQGSKWKCRSLQRSYVLEELPFDNIF